MTTPSYEKHTPSTDALGTLGSIIDEGEKRDAIHLAVEPAIAGQLLSAGQHVRFDPDTSIAMADTSGEGVGIVDPFLTVTVGKGERFWLVVYPRQINSLRHVWEHAAFAPSGETDVAPKVKTNRQVAEQWLRDFARNELYITDHDNGYGTTFETFIQTALDNDGYLTIIGQDASGEVPEEFWDHLEAYSGKPVTTRAQYFSCSC